MARPKYTITAADVAHARAYLENRIRNLDLQLEDSISYKVADCDFATACRSSHKATRATQINAWCEKYLNSTEWTKLKIAIRKRRERRIHTDIKTVTISGRAFDLLSSLAKRDGITYSQVLEKHLLKALNGKRR